MGEDFWVLGMGCGGELCRVCVSRLLAIVEAATKHAHQIGSYNRILHLKFHSETVCSNKTTSYPLKLDVTVSHDPVSKMVLSGNKPPIAVTQILVFFLFQAVT